MLPWQASGGMSDEPDQVDALYSGKIDEVVICVEAAREY